MKLWGTGKPSKEYIPCRSRVDVLADYGGEKGFYEAIDDERIAHDSEDYRRFYISRHHAYYMLKEIKNQLIGRRMEIPRNIELSLARIEGLLAER